MFTLAQDMVAALAQSPSMMGPALLATFPTRFPVSGYRITVLGRFSSRKRSIREGNMDVAPLALAANGTAMGMLAYETKFGHKLREVIADMPPHDGTEAGVKLQLQQAVQLVQLTNPVPEWLKRLANDLKRNPHDSRSLKYLCLPHHLMHVSRCHLIVKRVKPRRVGGEFQYLVQAPKCMNACYLNGVEMVPDVWYPLRDGDQVSGPLTSSWMNMVNHSEVPAFVKAQAASRFDPVKCPLALTFHARVDNECMARLRVLQGAANQAGRTADTIAAITSIISRL